MKKSTVMLVMLTCLLALVPAQAQDSSTRWWNDRVFYEIFVRSFYDSDGDGIGDLQGVIEKLDYLNDGDPATTDDLGITGIWLMPIMASPSYHGYDVTDYFAVNPDYGTNEDFLALMDAAHERGIAVIIDLEVNHTSREHPWFVASAAGDPEYRDWYRWDDSCPTYRGPWGQQVWIPLDDSCYYAVFWEGMPDLNYENPVVVEEMNNIGRYWLEEMGVDGYRLDGLRHIVEDGEIQESTPATLAWAAQFNDVVHETAPDALTVGEVWTSSFAAARYVPEGADLVFDFDLATAMMQSAMLRRSAQVTTALNNSYGLYPPNQFAAFLTNHDMNRVMAQLRTVEKAKLAATLLLTQPGVPFIYYGEEIGMVGAKPDERIRTPMQWASGAGLGFTTGTPWQAPQDDAEMVNVAAQTDDPDSLLSHYRTLIQLRNAHPALLHGSYMSVQTEARSVFSFVRHSAEETLLVVLNLDDEAVSEYTLNLSAGLAGDGSIVEGDGELVQPELNADGGFTEYVPLAELPAYSITLIQFGA